MWNEYEILVARVDETQLRLLHREMPLRMQRDGVN